MNIKNIFKKEKGGSDALLFALINVFVAIILMIIFLPAFKTLFLISDVNEIKRNTLLQMESTGSFSSDIETMFKDEISKLNDVTHVDINPETTRTAQYGTPLILSFDITYETVLYDINTLFDMDRENKVITTSFYGSTTMKEVIP